MSSTHDLHPPFHAYINVSYDITTSPQETLLSKYEIVKGCWKRFWSRQKCIRCYVLSISKIVIVLYLESPFSSFENGLDVNRRGLNGLSSPHLEILHTSLKSHQIISRFKI